MQITAKRGDVTREASDVTIVNLFEGVTKPGGATGAVDQALGGLVTTIIKEEGFSGTLGETLLIHTHGKIPAKRVLVVGLGEKEKLTTERIRRAAAGAFKACQRVKAKAIVSVLHGAGEGKIDPQEGAYAISTGTLLANYSFVKYQPERLKKEAADAVKFFTLVDRTLAKVSQAQKGIGAARAVFPGVKLARDLVNEPGLKVTPTELTREAYAIAKENPRVSVKIFNERELQKMGTGGLLAIARGSDEPAFLIHLTYRPKGKARLDSAKRAKKKIALVGKGLTFDTGGYSLKVQDFMNTMKLDMAGAATVLGVFRVLKEIAPDIEIHGIIPTTENLISGKAIKPGDIVTAMSGKTIEIINTDAEGRVILADALSYIAKDKWDAVIDFATLTGACIVALGETIGGLFSTNETLAQALEKAADKEGEPLWRLPLPEDYQELIKSTVADIQNVSKTKWGGAITAALFLQEFVPKDTPWAHLDIAGPAFAEKSTVPYLSLGGTGFAIRTMVRYLKELS